MVLKSVFNGSYWLLAVELSKRNASFLSYTVFVDLLDVRPLEKVQNSLKVFALREGDAAPFIENDQ